MASPLACLTSELHAVPGANYYILLMFEYRKSEITGGAVPQPAGVKLLSCDAKVCITCHRTKLGTYKNMQGHKLGDLVNRTA